MGERRPLTVLDNLDRDSEEKTESESPYFVQHQHSFDKPKRKGTKRNELEKALADVQHYKRKLALAEEKLKGIEKRLNFEQLSGKLSLQSNAIPRQWFLQKLKKIGPHFQHFDNWEDCDFIDQTPDQKSSIRCNCQKSSGSLTSVHSYLFPFSSPLSAAAPLNPSSLPASPLSASPNISSSASTCTSPSPFSPQKETGSKTELVPIGKPPRRKPKPVPSLSVTKVPEEDSHHARTLPQKNRLLRVEGKRSMNFKDHYVAAMKEEKLRISMEELAEVKNPQIIEAEIFDLEDEKKCFRKMEAYGYDAPASPLRVDSTNFPTPSFPPPSSLSASSPPAPLSTSPVSSKFSSSLPSLSPSMAYTTPVDFNVLQPPSPSSLSPSSPSSSSSSLSPTLFQSTSDSLSRQSSEGVSLIKITRSSTLHNTSSTEIKSPIDEEKHTPYSLFLPPPATSPQSSPSSSTIDPSSEDLSSTFDTDDAYHYLNTDSHPPLSYSSSLPPLLSYSSSINLSEAKFETHKEEEEEEEDTVKLKKEKVIRPDAWNVRLQVCLSKLRSQRASLNDRLVTNENLMHLYDDFVQAARAVGKIIISEICLPPEEKVIKPQTMGGQAGGEKFIVHNILFKFALDLFGLFGGSDAAAAKVAGHELKGLMAFASAGIKEINLPLLALVDHRGYRLVALSLLPVGADTLIYGSEDAGLNVVNKDPALGKIMLQAADILNLKPHLCGLRHESAQVLALAADLEGHRGKDGQYYLLDFSRCLPPCPPNKQFINSHLYQLFRREFVRKYKVPLCSDAFSGFIKLDENAKQHNTEVKESFAFLVSAVIPTCARELSRLAALPSSSQLKINVTSHLHRFGINLRYIGYVLEAIEDHWDNLEKEKEKYEEMIYEKELGASKRLNPENSSGWIDGLGLESNNTWLSYWDPQGFLVNKQNLVALNQSSQDGGAMGRQRPRSPTVTVGRGHSPTTALTRHRSPTVLPTHPPNALPPYSPNQASVTPPVSPRNFFSGKPEDKTSSYQSDFSDSPTLDLGDSDFWGKTTSEKKKKGKKSKLLQRLEGSLIKQEKIKQTSDDSKQIVGSVGIGGKGGICGVVILLLTEAIARVVKNELNLLLRKKVRDVKLPLEIPFRKLTVNFFNIIFGKNQAQHHWWHVVLPPLLSQCFNMRLTTPPPDFHHLLFNTLTGGGMRLFQRVLDLTGMVISSEARKRFEERGGQILGSLREPLQLLDLIEIGDRVKYPDMVSISQGNFFLCKSRLEVDSAAIFPLLTKAIERYDLALGTNIRREALMSLCVSLYLTLLHRAVVCDWVDTHGLYFDLMEGEEWIQKADEYMRLMFDFGPNDVDILSLFAFYLDKRREGVLAEAAYLRSLRLCPRQPYTALQYTRFLDSRSMVAEANIVFQAVPKLISGPIASVTGEDFCGKFEIWFVDGRSFSISARYTTLAVDICVVICRAFNTPFRRGECELVVVPGGKDETGKGTEMEYEAERLAPFDLPFIYLFRYQDQKKILFRRTKSSGKDKDKDGSSLSSVGKLFVDVADPDRKFFAKTGFKQLKIAAPRFTSCEEFLRELERLAEEVGDGGMGGEEEFPRKKKKEERDERGWREFIELDAEKQKIMEEAVLPFMFSYPLALSRSDLLSFFLENTTRRYVSIYIKNFILLDPPPSQSEGTAVNFLSRIGSRADVAYLTKSLNMESLENASFEKLLHLLKLSFGPLSSPAPAAQSFSFLAEGVQKGAERSDQDQEDAKNEIAMRWALEMTRWTLAIQYLIHPRDLLLLSSAPNLATPPPSISLAIKHEQAIFFWALNILTDLNRVEVDLKEQYEKLQSAYEQAEKEWDEWQRDLAQSQRIDSRVFQLGQRRNRKKEEKSQGTDEIESFLDPDEQENVEKRKGGGERGQFLGEKDLGENQRALRALKEIEIPKARKATLEAFHSLSILANCCLECGDLASSCAIMKALLSDVVCQMLLWSEIDVAKRDPEKIQILENLQDIPSFAIQIRFKFLNSPACRMFSNDDSFRRERTRGKGDKASSFDYEFDSFDGGFGDVEEEGEKFFPVFFKSMNKLVDHIISVGPVVQEEFGGRTYLDIGRVRDVWQLVRSEFLVPVSKASGKLLPLLQSKPDKEMTGELARGPFREIAQILSSYVTIAGQGEKKKVVHPYFTSISPPQPSEVPVMISSSIHFLGTKFDLTKIRKRKKKEGDKKK